MVQKTANGTKAAILKLLYENRDHFLSGQAISQKLGCSRTAVWKHVRELVDDGFRIEAVQKSGYRLTAAPEGANLAALQCGLRTKKMGQKIYFYEQMGSTQKKALELANENAEEGTLVVTNEQTAGRGRLGNKWVSSRGKNIAMSLILHPELPMDQTPQLTLLTAVAATETIEEVSGLSCGIKWPNDILYREKKLVGILTEMLTESDYVKSVVIGIGINVNTDKEAFADLQNRAASIKTFTGKEYDLSAMIQVFLQKFENLYLLYLSQGFASIKPLWTRRAISLGKQIRVRRPGGKILAGKALGIDNDGVLLLESADHHIDRIYSADIEWD